jgi:GDPmannose 4,6-dehydratase
VAHSVRDLCRVAFEAVGLDWQDFVRTDPSLTRPGQPTQLLANPSRARELLGWSARTPFEHLIRLMVDAERV